MSIPHRVSTSRNRLLPVQRAAAVKRSAVGDRQRDRRKPWERRHPCRPSKPKFFSIPWRFLTQVTEKASLTVYYPRRLLSTQGGLLPAKIRLFAASLKGG